MKYLDEKGNVIRNKFSQTEEEEYNPWKKYKLNYILGIRGVYKLIDGKKVVYVGKSRRCCMSRIIQHYQGKKKFTHFYIKKIDNLSDKYLSDLETKIIKCNQPKYNRQHTKKYSKHLKSTSLAKLVKRGEKIETKKERDRTIRRMVERSKREHPD